MSADCGIPGYGVEAHLDEPFVFGRMEGVARGDYPVNTAAIDEYTPLKWNAGRTELEPVTAAADELWGFLACDKPAGETRAGVFTQGDFNTDLVKYPAGVTADNLMSSNPRIFLKKRIVSGAE